MRRSIILAAAGVALAAQAAAAQGSCEDVKRYFNKPPKLGEWAELQLDMQKDAGKKPTVMRVGFVDREQRRGRPYYRMQMTMTQKDGKRQIMQMLTPWGTEAFSDEHDTELVMKMGSQPAVVMPIKGGQDQTGMTDLRKHCAKIEFVGEEAVEVPAGRYETRHYRGPDGDTWMSMDVPGWRVVKMVTKKGDTMVLTGTGDGAKNEITEKPVDMKAMMGGPGMKRKPNPDEEEAK